MQDDTGENNTANTQEVSPGSKLPKWALWGGGLAIAGAVGVSAVNNNGGPKWSADEADKAAQGTEITEAVPEEKKPEPKPEPDVRGVIKAKQESTVASKMTARIVSMPYSKGASFRRGALMASFDCSTIKAQLNAARAATGAYQKTYQTNVELDQYEAIGRNEVAVAKANLGKAAAEANAVRAQLSDCAVYAPFSGTVVDQIAHRGEVAASGQPLLKIQSGGELEVELIVPSNWLTWLRPGAAFTFKIDETGADVTGSVTSLGASVDPVSKTIRVMGSVGATESLILPGMSGKAIFDKPKNAAVPAANSAKTTATPLSEQAGTANGRKPS